MAKKGAALAVASSIPNLPAVGSTITETQAFEIAKQIAKSELERARAERRSRMDALAKDLGGQITRIDQGVVDQARQLAARLAAISQSRKSGRGHNGSGSDPLEPIVKKLGAVIGELESMMLLDRAVGLFDLVDEHEYVGWASRHSNGSTRWRDAVGEKSAKVATQILDQFTIVANEQPPSGKGKRGAKNVTPAPKTVDPDEIADEAVDEVNGEAEGDFE